MEVHMKTKHCRVLWLLLFALLVCQGCSADFQGSNSASVQKESTSEPYIDSSNEILSAILPYSGKPYVELNGNQPVFTEKEKKDKTAFENYSELDELERCGVAYANICKELMPTEERGAIGHIKPSGWHLIKYDIVDGKYLYNRCHLIGFQLAGENANNKNLITGTRYLNVTGMLPFENDVADYVKSTGNHVLYRVTPIFNGDELVARGVQMEAYSVEDGGEGICFHVFVYNNQPGVEIDYATGESWLSTEKKDAQSATSGETEEAQKYIVNKNTKKFHLPDCASATDTKAQNRKEVTSTKEEMIADGYEPCQRCNP